MAADHVLLPLAAFPTVGAWRDGPPRADRSAPSWRTTGAFDNLEEWTDLDGDGQIVIGAEQWPAA